MATKKLMDKIEKIEMYVKSSNNELEALYYFKIAFSIVTGAFLALLLKQVYSGDTGLRVIGIIIAFLSSGYLYFHLEHLYRSRMESFPDTVLKEFKGQLNFQEAQSNIDRKNTIDSFLDKSIEALNVNTCNVGYDSDPEICNQGLKEGIEKVLSDLILRTHYILNTDKSKFTIGIYLSAIIKEIENKHSKANTTEPKVFILRDDLNLENSIPIEMESSDGMTGLKFAYFNDIKYVLNHNRSRCYARQFEDDETQTVFMHPIPYICEADVPLGVIYILAEGNLKKEKDLDTVMLIFTRILSNWINKYDNCLQGQNIMSLKGMGDMPESAKKILADAEAKARDAKKDNSGTLNALDETNQ